MNDRWIRWCLSMRLWRLTGVQLSSPFFRVEKFSSNSGKGNQYPLHVSSKPEHQNYKINKISTTSNELLKQKNQTSHNNSFEDVWANIEYSNATWPFTVSTNFWHHSMCPSRTVTRNREFKAKRTYRVAVCMFNKRADLRACFFSVTFRFFRETQLSRIHQSAIEIFVFISSEFKCYSKMFNVSIIEPF